MTTITTEQRAAAREQIAADLADDWNPDRDPVLTAMFRDYAETAVCAVLAALGITVSDEPETPDDVIERVRHILSSGYGCVTCAVDDLRSAVGLPTVGGEHEHGPDNTAERIAQAIEAEGFNLDRVSVGVFEKFSVYNDALDLAARIAREVGEAGR